MTTRTPHSDSCHAFLDDALGTSDATELAQRLKSGKVSKAEVCEAAIQRAQSVNTYLQAIASNCFEAAITTSSLALKPSRTSNQKKQHSSGQALFSGIPTFIKDNTPVKGIPTSHGTDALRPKPENRHGPYTKQYLSQGFTLLGKSTLPEFGFNATTEPSHKPATRNPWNVHYSSGASSGGAAALVAAGVVPIAHGNDGGGSIRIPAACCGLIGLKPSRNRHVNSTQARALPINLVSEGVLTRSVRDTANFHHEAQKYYHNSKLPPLPLIDSPSKKRLRIGLIYDLPTDYDTDTETRQAVENTARQLQEMKHHVEEIPFPAPLSFAEDFSLYWAMMAFMVKHTGKLAIGTSFKAKRLDNLTHGLAGYYQKNAHKTPQFLYRLRQRAQEFQAVFDRYDLLLSPVLAQTPATLGHISPNVPFDELFERLTRYVGFTPMANVAGTPAISLPAGLSKHHLPIGIQLCAGMGQEQTLLETAFELEQAQLWKHLFETYP